MRFLILFIFSFFLLSACGPVRESETAQVDPELSARQYMQTGNYAVAAEEYLRLAAQDEQNAGTYRLKATAAFIEGGDYDRALQILKDTRISETDSLQNARRQIMSARLNLEFGQPGKAINLLQEMNVDEIPSNLRYAYHDILARAYLARGEYIPAAQERLIVRDFLNNETQQKQNYKALWEVFQAVPGDDLDDLRLTAPETMASWFELAFIYRAYRFEPEKLDYAIDSWVQRYPGHPAFTAIVPSLKEKSAQYVKRPQKIGLLLPLSNQYKKASIAIRDGFLAAWYHENAGQNNSVIKIYDANSLNVIEMYQQAVADGVEYVVGPLEKEAVELLIQNANLPVPVLALNRLDNAAETENEKLIQFGLSPEEEAKQVAEAALSDGHVLALIITPENNWGQRVAESFKQRWLEVGGAVLEQVSFSSELKDYTTPVKEALNIDSSEARITELRNKLNLKINAEERRRQDADFIFAAAVPADARQLLPQVRFFRADDLPIYSTSHIFSGVYDSARDNDMNDVMFLDMPWILDSRRQLSLIQDSLNRNWAQDKSSYRRLYALGIDAYRLIPEISRLRLEKDTIVSGETGDLRLGEDNVIRRKLRRAQFVSGKPVLLK